MTAVDACQRCIIKRQDGNMFHIANVEKWVVAING